MEALLGLGGMGVALIVGVIAYTMMDEKREGRGK